MSDHPIPETGPDVPFDLLWEQLPAWQLPDPGLIESTGPGGPGRPGGPGGPGPGDLMRVRIELLGIKPTIWREVILPGEITMDQVHEVIAAAMGWEDYHLHAFIQGHPRDHRAPRLLTAADLDEGEEGLTEHEVRLDAVLREPGDTVGYEYDFGDSWSHVLTLLAREPGLEPAPDGRAGARARLIAGERACPPEDVGGIGGYAEALTLLAGDPSADDEDAARLRDWLPGGFDPARLDFHVAARRLAATSTAGLLNGVALRPPVLDALERVRSARRFLTILLVDAHLPLESEPHPINTLTTDELARATAGWRALLEEIPSGGLRLTAAGYLPPAVVSRVAGLGLEPIPGLIKANREDLTPVVAKLRESAAALGLIRKARGVLTVTAEGRAGLADPRRLVARILSRMPFGWRDYQRDAGLLALLALAATDLSATASSNTGWMARQAEAAEVFGAFGWRQGYEPVPQPWIVGAMYPTLDILGWMGGFELDRYGDLTAPTPLGVALARAALVERPTAPRGGRR